MPLRLWLVGGVELVPGSWGASAGGFNIRNLNILISVIFQEHTSLPRRFLVLAAAGVTLGS